MKPRFFFLTVVLVAAILAGCAPDTVPTQAPPPAVDLPVNAPTTDGSQTTSADPAPTATEPAVVVAPPAVATSRGDRLEATDPATVSLATGSLHLVEFFRFT